VEVSPHQLAFSDYHLVSESDEPHYDFVIFTPKFDLTDHCAALREQFTKMKKTKP